jgi:hypothetical protein
MSSPLITLSRCFAVPYRSLTWNLGSGTTNPANAIAWVNAQNLDSVPGLGAIPWGSGGQALFYGGTTPSSITMAAAETIAYNSAFPTLKGTRMQYLLPADAAYLCCTLNNAAGGTSDPPCVESACTHTGIGIPTTCNTLCETTLYTFDLFSPSTVGQMTLYAILAATNTTTTAPWLADNIADMITQTWNRMITGYTLADCTGYTGPGTCPAPTVYSDPP